MTNHSVSLTVADPGDLPAFKKELQEAFAVAVVEGLGDLPDGPIPSDEDLDKSINAPGAVALRILCDGKKVGGAVVTIDEETHHNTLDLFFLKVGEQGHGLGHKDLANAHPLLRKEEHPLLRQQMWVQDHRVLP